MSYIKTFLSRTLLMVTAVLLVFGVGACSVGDDTNGDIKYDNAAMDDGLIGNAYKSGMLMGDIDAIRTVAAGKRDTVRYSDISTYITVNTIQIGNFPNKEILHYLPGATVVSPTTVSLDYIREEIPAIFNYRADHLKMEVTPRIWEFKVETDGKRRDVRCKLAADDGKITYEQLINWKYHFNLRLLTITVDGEPVEEYNSLDDSGKIGYVYNSWIINYNVF